MAVLYFLTLLACVEHGACAEVRTRGAPFPGSLAGHVPFVGSSTGDNTGETDL